MNYFRNWATLPLIRSKSHEIKNINICKSSPSGSGLWSATIVLENKKDQGFIIQLDHETRLNVIDQLLENAPKILEIKGVKIGDKFRPDNAKHIVAEVVDFLELKSMVTGEITGYQCIAKNITGFAKNTYEVTFTSVKRYAVT